MKSPTPAKKRLLGKASIVCNTRPKFKRAGPWARLSARSTCIVSAIALLSFIATATASASPTSVSQRFLQGALSGFASGGLDTLARPSAPVEAGAAVGGRVAERAAATAPLTASGFVPPVFPLIQSLTPIPEAIGTFAADCTTPKTDFTKGDTVCVKVTGTVNSVFPLSRKVYWIDPDGAVIQKDTISSTTNTVTRAVNTRGVWRAYLVSGNDATLRMPLRFNVSDPQNASADLAVFESAVINVSSFAPGTSATYQVIVSNQGPDAASNVVLSQGAPNNSTFVSASQLSGPTFSCQPNGTGCSISSLAAGSVAVFNFVYQLDGNVSAGTTISATANVASVAVTDPNNPQQTTPATDELHPEDNTSTDEHVVVVSPCVVTCPSDITVNAAAGQAGAVVNYSVTTNGSNCGSSLIYSVPSGSFFPAGTTTVTVAGQTGDACSFLVTVNNPGGLSITLNGDNPMTFECGDDFNDPGATAVDSAGQAVPVTVSGTFDPNTDGTYTLTYTATEGQNSVSTTRTINVVDTQPPAITVAGANPLNVGCNQTFVDPGASAVDACDGTVAVQASPTTLDTSTPGTYTITYTAHDSHNHTATATRTVVVGADPNDPPVVTLNGAPQMTIECGSVFTDPGATASAGCVSLQVTTDSNLDTHTPGTYTITYSATASNNLSASATRVVEVVDTTPPVITVNGANPLVVECHTSFTDPGATAADGCAGSFAATASGAVDVDHVGSYTITYTASDPSGNPATPVTRTVNVVDTTAPTISGVADVSVTTGAGATSCGAFVSDAQLGTASATDGCAGSVGVTRTGVPAGNVFPVGSTTVTYTASDPSGNTATKTQTVTVTDNTPPTVSVPANIVVQLPPNSTATSAVVTFTVTAADNCPGVTLNVSPASGSSFPAGTTTVTATATDAHGNTTTATFTVTVLYNFTGFFSPVANPPTLNVVNAGRAVPVKFSLSGNKGLNIFAADSPSSAQFTCNDSDPAVDVSQTVEANSNSISYDANADQYNFVWKTDSAWAGTCRQLVVQLNDGSIHRANFKFR